MPQILFIKNKSWEKIKKKQQSRFFFSNNVFYDNNTHTKFESES